MGTMLRRRGLVIAGLLLIVAAVIGYEALSKRTTDGGAPGKDTLDKRWDPSGSHPLPNEGVGRPP